VNHQREEEIDPQLEGATILQRGVIVMIRAILEDVALQDGAAKEETRLVIAVVVVVGGALIPTLIVMTVSLVVRLAGEVAETKMIWWTL